MGETAGNGHSGGGAAIESVIARMLAIEAGLPEADGVARFNDLYLAVTRQVAAELDAEEFEDPAFVAALDVVFASLYFAAVDAAVAGGTVANAWEPLFESRSRPSVAPIQHALAGMNAHINYDLCLALTTAHADAGVELERGSPQHRDYLRLNEILERVQERVKERFAQGLVGVADEALGRLDDVVAIWSVARARDAAWTHAEVLWTLGPVEPLRTQYLAAMGRFVGLAGRGLLVPTL